MQRWLWLIGTNLIHRLPVQFVYKLAKIIGKIVFVVWVRGRKNMLANYKHVLPNATESERRKIARQSLENYCCYIVDFARLPNIPPHLVESALAKDELFEAIDRALERERGLIVVVMHFGNWDLGASSAALKGYPITVLAETFSDRHLDKLIVSAREKLGLKVTKIEGTAPSIIRDLRNNRLLAILLDRPMQDGEGVQVKFFGSDLVVPAGPARLALRTGAAIVNVAFPKLRSNDLSISMLSSFVASQEEGPDRNNEDAVQKLTQTIMDEHEKFIRLHPTQWYMFRRMWPLE